ncbi:MAG: ATP synthase F1 subunit delta [Clostridiales bacterium GWC2_40_7]|nr:MAG: ATP synthase F1 subunit delta [Clostridiales bacterium GWC2_40_7]
MSLVEKRYAEALIGIAVEKKSIDVFLQDLETFAKAYSDEPGFKDFLVNPQNRMSLKKDIINNAFNGRIESDIINFVSLLLDKGRIKYMPEIYEEFSRLADEKRSILNIKVITATPLDEIQINTIADKYRKLYNAASVKAHVKVDANLIGGVKVIIGDKVTDVSVKSRLSELQRLLMK